MNSKERVLACINRQPIDRTPLDCWLYQRPEVYVWNRFLELETLGPLVRLEPGAATTHVETWEFYPGVHAAQTIEGVRSLIGDLGVV